MENIKKYGVKRIGLFGSYAGNDQKSESDIDVLVGFERGKKTFDNYMDLKFFLALFIIEKMLRLSRRGDDVFTYYGRS